jgi:hypothetical protein
VVMVYGQTLGRTRSPLADVALAPLSFMDGPVLLSGDVVRSEHVRIVSGGPELVLALDPAGLASGPGPCHDPG